MPRSNQRSCTPDDKRLGDKIRIRRQIANISQMELGEVLGISFQQIQKYEKGVNRVSAVRLEQIAEALGEQVSYFQSNHGGTLSKAGQELQSMLADSLNLRICRALGAIDDQNIKHQIVRLAERLGKA